jgi:hypothetical protein
MPKKRLQGPFALEDSDSAAILVGNFNDMGTDMSKLSIISEFWQFLKVRKKWWLLPIVLSLLLLGALIVFAEGSALSPFIYTLF